MSRSVLILAVLTLLSSATALVSCTEDRLSESPITLLPEQDRLLPNGLAAEQVSGYFKVLLLLYRTVLSLYPTCRYRSAIRCAMRPALC